MGPLSCFFSFFFNNCKSNVEKKLKGFPAGGDNIKSYSAIEGLIKRLFSHPSQDKKVISEPKKLKHNSFHTSE